MMKKIGNNFNYKLAISLFVLTLAIVYLGLMTIQSSKTYYLTIDEISSANSSDSFRVAGKLILESYTRESDSTMSTFNITDEGKILKASFEGVLPDMFFSSKSEQIILEGKLINNGELFKAENVIVKCPSKYEE